jgi:hypothetical protein
MEVEYAGPENVNDYLAWLTKEYPWSVNIPINSLWEFGGNIAQVVGYCLLDDKEAIHLCNLPTPKYENIRKASFPVHVDCFLMGAKRQSRPEQRKRGIDEMA